MEYEVRYLVYVTKKARKDGSKLGISDEAHLTIREELKLLKYWPDSQNLFDFEKVNGALKFNFDYVDGRHWIRVFVYQDDVRKTMWIMKVVSKKTNKISKNDIAAVDALVREMEADIKQFQKEQQHKNRLVLLKGGKQ